MTLSVAAKALRYAPRCDTGRAGGKARKEALDFRAELLQAAGIGPAEIEQFIASLSSIKCADQARQKDGDIMLRAKRKIALIACGLAGLSTHAGAAGQTAWPDDYQARLEIWALIETLNANLLASRSATETLATWCASHHMAKEPKIVAHLDNAIAKPVSEEQRRALEIGPNEPVASRRVELACGDHVLSQADNWYVPSRLTPAMNAELQSTDHPFGRVVQPLAPRRQTIAVKILWQPLPQGWEMQAPPAAHAAQNMKIPALLFEHRAIVYGSAGMPISEVDESYRAEILDFERAR
jgi:chorismate-pyruvate lyase